MLVNIHSPTYANVFPSTAMEEYSHVFLDFLHKGDIFGEHSAINGDRHPYTVEAESSYVTVYRISRESLRQIDVTGVDIVEPLRAQTNKMTNWLRLKT